MATISLFGETNLAAVTSSKKTVAVGKNKAMEWLVQTNKDVGHEAIQRTPWKSSIKKGLSNNKGNTIESNKKIACKNQRSTISTPASIVPCQYSRISIENCSNSKKLLMTNGMKNTR